MTSRFFQPYFFYRPGQFFQSLARKFKARPAEFEARMPWGDTLSVNPREAGGHRLYMHGIHDLPVTEVVFRVLSPGDLALDVGANLGAMTSALSWCVGREGRVLSFEANPTVFQRLQRNIARMQNGTAVTAANKAVSDSTGVLTLVEGGEFANNQGTSHVLRPGETNWARTHQIPSCTLDEVLPRERVKLCKIDVERHEFEVFKGARKLLTEGRIETIVFEDWKRPTEMQEFLKSAGYSVYELDYSLSGLHLTEPRSASADQAEDAISDFVATRNEGVVAALQGKGWRCLHP
jgi:FkbM family methyltransferase